MSCRVESERVLVLVLALISIAIDASCESVVRDVRAYGAVAGDTTDDTAAINSAISALRVGDELFFPCGTYLVSSALKVIRVSHVTIAGAPGCVTIKGTNSGYNIMQVGTTSLSQSAPLNAATSELSSQFLVDVTKLGGITSGDYVFLQQGGRDFSSDTAPGHDTICDVSGCRGEVLQIESISDSTALVSTALHYSYDPVLHDAKVAKLINPPVGVSVRDLTFDGSGTVSSGLYIVGVVNSTVSNVTASNFRNSGLYSYLSYNLAWNNVTVTGAGSGESDAFLLASQGNPRVDGANLNNLNANAFGMGLHTVANGIFTDVTIDKAGTTSGRPFKMAAASYNTFTRLTVRNGAGGTGYNGMSLGYYSSHNTFNDCVVANNSGHGIASFGNNNQFNKFINCTVNQNSQWQFGQTASALRQFNDTHWEISGGTYTGADGQSVMQINGAYMYIHDVSIQGPGQNGMYVGGSNNCVNNNKFNGPFTGYDIVNGGSNNQFSGNSVGRTDPAALPFGRCPA